LRDFFLFLLENQSDPITGSPGFFQYFFLVLLNKKMSFGNIARDIGLSSLSTLRSTASKSTNGLFSANVRTIGALLQYERSPDVWVTAETKRVPSTQLGNVYTLPGKTFITQISLSQNGSVIAVGLDGVQAGSVLSILTNTAGFYSQQAIPIPPDAVGVTVGSVSLSDDGKILAFGGCFDNANVGAVWLYANIAGVWTLQGTKITGPGEIGAGQFGRQVSLSGNGTLLAVGSPHETPAGAAYIFNTQYLASPVFMARLVGTPLTGGSDFGWDVKFSADGSTLAVGASSNLGALGSAFIFTKVQGTWQQQAYLLAPSGLTTQFLGYNVSLSADGNTLCASSTINNVIYYRTPGSSSWSAGTVPPLPYDLIETTPFIFGNLSQDGNTLCVSSKNNNQEVGATWIFSQGPGETWVQNGPGFVGTGAPIPMTKQGFSNISGDGSTVAVMETSDQGLVWVFV